jgi:hypothetical protein
VHDEVRRRLGALLAHDTPDERALVVNVHGPVGVGKSRLLTALTGALTDLATPGARLPAPATGVQVVDGVDHAAHVAAVLAHVRRSPRGAKVVVAGRIPLAARAGWTADVVAVPVSPVSGHVIAELAAGLGIRGAREVDLVVRLSGGIPLIADTIARALRTGGSAEVPGALADTAARELLARIGAEAAGPSTRLVPTLAAVGGADEDLLAALVSLPRNGFDRLAGLSVVRAERRGLTVAEPYRSVFDLAYRWRHPVAHRRVAVRATRQRLRQIPDTADHRLRAELAEQVLFLSPQPWLRDTFFPGPDSAVRVVPAPPDAEQDVTRLVHRWADQEGLDHRRVDRMLELWLPAGGFRMAVDGTGEAVGLANICPLDADVPALEPLLQQHFTALAKPGGGVVLGMLVADERRPAVRAALLRHVLIEGVANGRIVVSTSWAPYQELCTQLGLRHVGETGHDFYRCGRTSELFNQRFSTDMLGAWLRKLDRSSPGRIRTGTEAAVLAALPNLHRPERLADNPLLAVPGLGTPEVLARFLRARIDELAAAPSAVDAEAGWIMHQYYVVGRRGHLTLANSRHLSRATYFRRRDHGVARLVEAIELLLTDP